MSASKIKFKKGDRVKTKEGAYEEEVHGKVIKGGQNNIQVILDGGEFVLNGPAVAFELSNKSLPEEPENPMNKWSVKKYQEIQGHGDSPTFNAEIALNGKSVIHVENDGWGGPNLYFNIDSKGPDYVKQLHEDVQAWWDTYSKRDVIEKEDLWLDWHVNKKDFGVTSPMYIQRFNEEMDKLNLNDENFVAPR